MTHTTRLAALCALAAFLLTPALRAQSTDSAPASRALASPLDSPPFPSSDWLGGPVIGEPDGTPDYPLQKAVFGSALAASRIKIYGWADLTGNVSTSTNSNAPLSPTIVPNAFELDQLVLRIDRAPNTVQTAHADWGFRFTSLYGIDYRYTTAKGWFSDQLLQHNDLYGYDPTELYAVLYLPHIAQGAEFKLGRFLSPADIDDPFAPDNYLLTLTITVDPVTFTGLEAIVRLNQQWALTLGVDAGSDMAPWQNSAQLNGQAMVRWVSLSGNDGLWGGINSLGNGEFTNGHELPQRGGLREGLRHRPPRLPERRAGAAHGLRDPVRHDHRGLGALALVARLPARRGALRRRLRGVAVRQRHARDADHALARPDGALLAPPLPTRGARRRILPRPVRRRAVRGCAGR